MQPIREKARQLRNHATTQPMPNAACGATRADGSFKGFRFRTQVPLAGFIADFACPQAKLVVELDGGQHASRMDDDARRTLTLERHGYRVLRYWNDDVLLRAEDVVADIHRELTKSFTPPRPSPSLREREGAEATAEGTGTAAGDLQLAPVRSLRGWERATATAAGDNEAEPDPRFTPSLSPQAKGRVGEGCT